MVAWSRTGLRVKELAEQVPAGVSVLAASTPAEVLDCSDVVCTLTPSTRPIVAAADVRPGVLWAPAGKSKYERD